MTPEAEIASLRQQVGKLKADMESWRQTAFKADDRAEAAIAREEVLGDALELTELKLNSVIARADAAEQRLKDAQAIAAGQCDGCGSRWQLDADGAPGGDAFCEPCFNALAERLTAVDAHQHQEKVESHMDSTGQHLEHVCGLQGFMRGGHYDDTCPACEAHKAHPAVLADGRIAELDAVHAQRLPEQQGGK